MYGISLVKDAGKLIEMQSNCYDPLDPGVNAEEYRAMNLNTLLQNALNMGFKEDEIEVKFVCEDEWQHIWEANKATPIYRDLRRREYPTIGDQIDNIVKTLKYLSEKGIDIGSEGREEIELCMAVKAKYPKPV